MTFKDHLLNFMTFQAWKMKCLNSMTFQIFYDQYELRQYIPRKLVVGQSAAHKKTISYSKHEI